MLIGDRAIVSALKHGEIPAGIAITRANGYRDARGYMRKNRYLCEEDTGRTRGVIYYDGSGNVGGASLEFRVRRLKTSTKHRSGRNPRQELIDVCSRMCLPREKGPSHGT